MSKYLKIIRVMGWIRRFIGNSRDSQTRSSGELTAGEFTSAELIILKLCQQESFKRTNVTRLNTLNIYTDKNGLLRLETPVVNRKDVYVFCRPIILDHKRPLTKKIIEYEHQRLSHAGVLIMMNNLRERFWILSCRATVRSVIKNCVVCKRYSSQKLETPTSSLPNERVREANVFEITGIDYAGPLFLRNSEKTWIYLFTCAVYRAVHLEITTSLSTKAFLQVLTIRRFIARRGRPSIVYTDNGKNFVGTYNLLRKIDWAKINLYASTQKIDWRLNPPSAA